MSSIKTATKKDLASKIVDATVGAVSIRLPKASASGLSKSFFNYNLNNTAILLVKNGDYLNGVLNGTFSFNNFPVNTQFIAVSTDNQNWSISSITSASSDAEDINYSNITSGLNANDVQVAIDELSAEKVDKTQTIAGTALSGNITQDNITGLSTNGIIKRTGANTLATATAGVDYQVALVSGVNIRPINGQSLLGSNPLTISTTLDINTLTTKATPVDNDVVVIGDSEAGFATKKVALSAIQGNASETLVKLSGETRVDFTSSIDIPIDIENYEKITIEANTIQNDTNTIRLRGVLLNINKDVLSHNYVWTGSTTVETGTQSPEFSGVQSYLPIASEASAAVSSSNISSHTITLEKQTATQTIIKSEYLFTNTSNIRASGYINTLATNLNTSQGSYGDISAQGSYSQSSVYPSNVNVTSNQTLLRDSNVSTGSATNSETNAFIAIDFGFSRTIDRIVLASPDSNLPGGWGGGSYTNGCELQYSVNGSSWTTITTLSGFSTGTTQTYTNTIIARYVRVFRASGYVALTELRAEILTSNINVTTPSYLRIYATSGLVKGTCYVYGLKKSNVFLPNTEVLLAPSASIASSASTAPSADILLGSYKIQA